MPDLHFAGESSCGLIRERNEDNFFYFRAGDNRAISAVCDGIGGHNDGHIASFFCCRELMYAWHRQEKHIHTQDEACAFLQAALSRINASLFRTNEIKNAALPMGTTVAVCIFLRDKAVCCHVGDSRFYFCRPGTPVIQQTRDHSMVCHIAENGQHYCTLEIPDCENIIIRALGVDRHIQLDFSCIPRYAGSRYLLTTDGLTREVEQAAIDAALQQESTPAKAVGRMIRDALVAGGRDNITALCAFESPQFRKQYSNLPMIPN